MSLKSKIEEIIEIPIDSIKPEDKLLGLVDSIKLVQLAGVIEEHTGLEIHEGTIYMINGKWLRKIVDKYN